jgi:regulatory protein
MRCCSRPPAIVLGCETVGRRSGMAALEMCRCSSMSDEPRKFITGLEQQERGRRRVNVYVDGLYAFALEPATVLSHGLRVGMAFDERLRSQLQEDDARERAHEAAITLLSYRPRSEKELRQRLRRKGFAPETVDLTLDRLRSAGLVDDRAFGEFWINNRQAFRPRGERALKQELATKGVDRSVVDEILAERPADEAGEAMEIARRKAASMRGLERDVFYRRLTGFLARRGYSWDVAGPIVRSLWQGADAEDGGDCSDE